MKQFNKIIGTAGESLAEKYLKKKKYKILAKNYTNRLGEIDIIASKKKVIVFVEVKTKTTLEFGRPSEMVTDEKQRKIHDVASLYLISSGLYDKQPVRFDVVEVLGENEINHIENAF